MGLYKNILLFIGVAVVTNTVNLNITYAKKGIVNGIAARKINQGKQAINFANKSKGANKFLATEAQALKQQNKAMIADIRSSRKEANAKIKDINAKGEKNQDAILAKYNPTIKTAKADIAATKKQLKRQMRLDKQANQDYVNKQNTLGKNLAQAKNPKRVEKIKTKIASLSKPDSSASAPIIADLHARLDELIRQKDTAKATRNNALEQNYVVTRRDTEAERLNLAESITHKYGETGRDARSSRQIESSYNYFNGQAQQYSTAQ